MVNICIEYTGNLHCDAVHGPSHAKISTDAPTDNKGKGESFSPTDLVATALGTCMSTILAMAAQEHGLEVKGMTVNVSKEMSKDAPVLSMARTPVTRTHPSGWVCVMRFGTMRESEQVMKRESGACLSTSRRKSSRWGPNTPAWNRWMPSTRFLTRRLSRFGYSA